MQASSFLRGVRFNWTTTPIRFIEHDEDSFLAWATESLVCIVCNLHARHSTEGLILPITTDRWATTLKAVTHFIEFLRLNRKYDPQERFRNNRYGYYERMFADRIGGAIAVET